MTYLSKADLGGQTGHGPIVPEREGELFHAAWEPRVLALTLAMGATGSWNIDMSRAARETLEDYGGLSYYEIWFGGLCRLMQERGLVTAEELEQGRVLQPAMTLARTLHAADVAAALARGSPTERAATAPPRFGVGQRVRMSEARPPHHTRLPGYVRGKVGIVERLHGAHVFADSHAHGKGEDPHWLYTVAFDAADLWPVAAGSESAARGESRVNQRFTVSVDAWEPYLEPHDADGPGR